jgi:hypothetical protein
VAEASKDWYSGDLKDAEQFLCIREYRLKAQLTLVQIIWINDVHSLGVQDYRTFFTLLCLRLEGYSLALLSVPKLPLVLAAGILSSWLGIVYKQSMFQARILNLTAASAAVGGFFGFPMAEALFVLEIPHGTGLHYFEALSPATIGLSVADYE